MSDSQPLEWRKELGEGRRNHSRVLDSSLVAARMFVSSVWSEAISAPALTTFYSASLDADRQAILESGRPEFARGAALPWAAIVVASMSENVEGPYAGYAAQKHGIRIGKTVNGQFAYEFVRPVTVGLGIRARFNDVTHAHAFASLWLAAGPRTAIDLRRKDLDRALRVGLQLDTSVTLPPNGSQPGNFIDIDTTLAVHTYVGQSATLLPVLKLNLGINLGGLAAEQSMSFRRKTDGSGYILEDIT